MSFKFLKFTVERQRTFQIKNLRGVDFIMSKDEKLEELSYFYQLNAEVLIDIKLSDFEKLLYSLINGLSKGKNGCFASDEYFAKIFNKSISTISRSLRNLEKLGYIFRETYSKGENRGSARNIFTQETLKNKGGLIRKNDYQSKNKCKNDKSTVRKNGQCTVVKNEQSLINNKQININNNDFDILEKIRQRIFKFCFDNKYNHKAIQKISSAAYKFNTKQDLLSLEKRIINGELRF